MDSPDFMDGTKERQVTFSGFCQTKMVGNHEHFFVRNPETGYLTDINNRLEELVLNYGRKVTAALYVSNDVATIDEIVETVLAEMDGVVDIEYSAYERSWSEYTSEIVYESSMKIGGHDFENILLSQYGKYILFTVAFPK